MARFLQTSVDLKPDYKSHRVCRESHGEMVSGLGKLGADHCWHLCSEIARCGEYHNFLNLNELSDKQLFALSNYLRSKPSCDYVVNEITEVLDARERFRQSLHPRVLLLALIRNNLRGSLEQAVEGRMSHGYLFDYAKKINAGSFFQKRIDTMLIDRDKFLDVPNTNLIVKGYLCTDRII